MSFTVEMKLIYFQCRLEWVPSHVKPSHFSAWCQLATRTLLSLPSLSPFIDPCHLPSIFYLTPCYWITFVPLRYLLLIQSRVSPCALVSYSGCQAPYRFMLYA